jgi:hypothetical protein
LIYSRLRDIRRLQQLLEDPAVTKSPMMYNVAIGAFAKAGEHSKVAILLQQMETQRMRLSRSTAVTLSSLLLKAGKLQLAQAVLDMNQQQQMGGVGGGGGGEARLSSAGRGTTQSMAAQPPTAPAAPSSFVDAVDDDVTDTLLQERHDEDVRRALQNPERVLGEDDEEV